MSGPYRFGAFISYSHEDRYWARWLHRRLEAYRPPKSLRTEKAIGPVFPIRGPWPLRQNCRSLRPLKGQLSTPKRTCSY